MSKHRELLFVLLVTMLAACQEPSVGPKRPVQAADPLLSSGGIPGPPPHVIIRIPPAPPPRVPVPLPPRAGPPSFLTNIVEVGAGIDFSCALRSDGAVYCWGGNARGQLGDGSLAPSSIPVEVTGPERFVRLFVGDWNACGLTSTGAAYCWGDNSLGQLGAGLPPGAGKVPAAVAGGHSFLEISIGLRSSCGIATDGATYCWGTNAQGQLGIGSAGGSMNVPVAVTNSASLGFVTVSAGFQNACALTGSGAVYCWGGQPSLFGNPASAPSTYHPTPAANGGTFASIEVGSLYACGVDGTGSASCWGTQVSGELGTGSFASPVATPAPVVGGLRFASFDSHNNNSIIASTCGVTPSGEAWCWGSNQDGQLGATAPATCTFGVTTYPCSAAPLKVGGSVVFDHVAVGSRHHCGVDIGGDVWCWGSNNTGQLGDGTMVNNSTPVRASGLNVPQRIGSIVVSPDTTTLRLLGSTHQFTAHALDESGVLLPSQPSFMWSSSNAAVAPVSAAGVATALMTGQAIITATAPDGSTGRAVLNVSILDPVLAFQEAWVGTSAAGGAGPTDGIVVLGGLLADEWGHSGTFVTRREVDLRSISSTNLTVAQAYSSLALARTALEFEASRVQGVTPSDPRIGAMLTLAGYTYIAFAETFCSGVPLDDPNGGKSTTELLNLALARFAQARGGPVLAPYDVLATAGTARAQLGLGNYAAAAAAAAGIPAGFAYNTTHTAIGHDNFVYAMSVAQRRITVSEGEGTNGLPFRSANDPRVAWTFTGLGFNAVTPHYALLKYPASTAPLTIASDTEARLIEAEAALQGGNVGSFMGVLNALRGSGGLSTLLDPGTVAGRVDLLFQERAFWLFATGTRLGDARRLINHYGRPAVSVLPTGPEPFGGAYGSDANLPVPASARGGGYAGCTNRGS